MRRPFYVGLACVVAWVLCLLSLAFANHSTVLSNPQMPVPDPATATFITASPQFADHEIPLHLAGSWTPFVTRTEACIHAASGTLTSVPFACEAYVPERVNQTATAITYAAASSDVCWTILSSDNDGITSWTRVGATALYYLCEGDATPNQPDLPPNSTWLMQITVTSSALATVTDLRKLYDGGTDHIERFASFNAAIDEYNDSGDEEITLALSSRMHMTSDITLPNNIRLQKNHRGLIDLDNSATLTWNGELIASPTTTVFTGTGTVDFTANAVQRVYHAAWWGVNTDATAAANTTAMHAAYAALPNNAVIALPPGLLNFNPVASTKPHTLQGFGRAKLHSAEDQALTTVRCVDVDEYCWSFEPAGSGGQEAFYIEGIKFDGGTSTPGLGFAGILFGRDDAAGTTTTITVGGIRDVWINNFTTYGITFRRAYDTQIENLLTYQIRNAATLSTAGYGIYLKAFDPASAGDTHEITTLRFQNCNSSINHIGVYIEEGEQVSFTDCIFSSNDREGFKVFAEEFTTFITVTRAYFEGNNLSRNDAGHAAPAPFKYYTLDFNGNVGVSALNEVRMIDMPKLLIKEIAGNGQVWFENSQFIDMYLQDSSADTNKVSFELSAQNAKVRKTTATAIFVASGHATPDSIVLLAEIEGAWVVSRGLMQFDTNNIKLGSSTLLSLGACTAGMAGQINWCSDCAVSTTPCTASSTGALAVCNATTPRWECVTTGP